MKKLILATISAVSLSVVLYLFFAAVAQASPNQKVQLCHAPPGNPDNAHTIVVNEQAAMSHIKNHPYDMLGECPTNTGCKGDDSFCSDNNLCTEDICHDDGSCDNRPIDPSSCNDGNECTLDLCDPALGCVNEPLEGDSCNDGNECTDNDVCDDAGVCSGESLQGCCLSDTDCDDDNLCTNDLCENNTCVNEAIDCEDSGPCTVNVCVDGVCDSSPAVCDDGNLCTEDTCDLEVGCIFIPIPGSACNDNGTCLNNSIPGCLVCETDADCADGNSCIEDICDDGGICRNPPSEGCCETDADCADGNSCTENICVAGGDELFCENSDTENCTLCETDSDCPSGQECSDGVVCSDIISPPLFPSSPSSPPPTGYGGGEDSTPELSVPELININAFYSQRFTITVKNANPPGILRWNIENPYDEDNASVAWLLSIAPKSGVADYNNSDTVTVVIDTDGLGVGIHIAYIPVTSNGGHKVVTVRMTIPEQTNTAVPPPTPDCNTDFDCNDGIFCNGEETCDAGECVVAAEDACNSEEICMEALEQCWGLNRIEAQSRQKNFRRPRVRAGRCPWLVLKIDEANNLDVNQITMFFTGPADDAQGVSINYDRTTKEFRNLIMVPICIQADATAGEWLLDIETYVRDAENPFVERISYVFEIK